MAIAVPPQGAAAAYARLFNPLLDRIYANVAESHTLAALRDTLLPKLISGEIRVLEAERAVERAL